MDMDIDMDFEPSGDAWPPPSQVSVGQDMITEQDDFGNDFGNDLGNITGSNINLLNASYLQLGSGLGHDAPTAPYGYALPHFLLYRTDRLKDRPSDHMNSVFI
jgi:hypothetical protein